MVVLVLPSVRRQKSNGVCWFSSSTRLVSDARTQARTREKPQIVLLDRRKHTIVALCPFVTLSDDLLICPCEDAIRVLNYTGDCRCDCSSEVAAHLHPPALVWTRQTLHGSPFKIIGRV